MSDPPADGRAAHEIESDPPVAERERLGRVSLALLLAAVAFCTVVVWQRDSRMQQSAMRSADGVLAALEAFLNEYQHLPPVLADDALVDAANAEIPYPSREDVVRLRGKTGPFVLFAGPRQGLILPGRDGAAAVFFEAGKLSTRWLNMTELAAERERRAATLKP